jgi:hypothetical protein
MMHFSFWVDFKFVRDGNILEIYRLGAREDLGAENEGDELLNF